MLFPYIEVFTAIYIAGFIAIVDTINFTSAILFKAVPGILALFLAIDALSRLGFI